MPHSLINPADTLERQNQKLIQISEALMRRVEQDTDRSGAAYAQFERAAMLEDQVRSRTRDLEHALDLLNDSNAQLAEAKSEAEAARANLANAIEAVQEGFALFDRTDVMVMCNSRFGMHMIDVQARLDPGLRFADYVGHVSNSRFLELPEGMTPAAWAARRMQRHKDRHVIFNVHLIWDRWLQVSEHRTPDGGTVVLQTDVTDIMRLERQERGKLLDDQARMIRATLDHLNQGVCIFDKDARLAGWNKRIGSLLAVPVSLLRIGMGFDTLLDRLKEDFQLSQLRPKALLNWAQKKDGRRPLSFEVRQGNDITLDVFAQEMPDRGFVISFTDVSAERQANRALFDANELLERRVMERTLELEDALTNAERANASKTRFVAAASHDLLQPLSAAKLYMSSLAEGADSPAAKALNALSSVENIIDALLDISKLDSGTASLDVTTVSLGDLLAGLRDEFAPLAALKGLDLRVVPSTAFVTSDPGFLRRILQNLIGNAVRYTQAGRVLVGARRNGGSVRVEVWDTGPGIPEADQDRIFKEFERLDARASASEGLGLGLAIVERACARLGHPLGLWSVVGQGTGFFVNLAHAEGAALPRPKASHSAPRQRLRQKGLIVMLVENDLELRRAMCALMEGWDVSVLDVGDAAEALDLLEEIQISPDALLIDYHLGDGADGLALIEDIHRLFGTIPARLISANRSPDLRRRASANGVELMPKPIDADLLEAFLCSALDEGET
ncbi:MAG: PAS-domain containing protein [Rhodobacter sp.]|nr:PAS-domain containing protein [Rhodobacter sp.]